MQIFVLLGVGRSYLIRIKLKTNYYEEHYVTYHPTPPPPPPPPPSTHPRQSFIGVPPPVVRLGVGYLKALYNKDRDINTHLGKVR